MLHTNQTYLYNTIHTKLSITFKEYIRNLRIDYACKMLDQCAEKFFSIEEIVHSSGFGSRATLYRQFRETLGMTPDEYRGRGKREE